MRICLVAVFISFAGGIAAAQDAPCNQDLSKQEVQRLTGAGQIKSIDVFMPNVTVVVDERAWKRSDLAAKTAIAQNIDCATVGPRSKMLRSIYFRSSRDNKQLGEYSRQQLRVAD